MFKQEIFVTYSVASVFPIKELFQNPFFLPQYQGHFLCFLLCKNSSFLTFLFLSLLICLLFVLPILPLFLFLTSLLHLSFFFFLQFLFFIPSFLLSCHLSILSSFFHCFFSLLSRFIKQYCMQH